jgi:hypothetical protein
MHSAYPYDDLPDDEVLLYRHSADLRFSCQAPGCVKTFKERSAALIHGKTHLRDLGLARARTHTGPRPVGEETYKDYRRKYVREWKKGHEILKKRQITGAQHVQVRGERRAFGV